LEKSGGETGKKGLTLLVSKDKVVKKQKREREGTPGNSEV